MAPAPTSVKLRPEGETKDAVIETVRKRKVKNFLRSRRSCHSWLLRRERRTDRCGRKS
jgi:hypothetical protein